MLKIISKKKYESMKSKIEELESDKKLMKSTIHNLNKLDNISTNEELVKFIVKLVENCGEEIQNYSSFLPYTIRKGSFTPRCFNPDNPTLSELRGEIIEIPPIRIQRYMC